MCLHFSTFGQDCCFSGRVCCGQKDVCVKVIASEKPYNRPNHTCTVSTCCCWPVMCCTCLQVLRYLQAFAAAFHLHQYVKFDTEVINATPQYPDSQQQPQQQHQHQHQQETQEDSHQDAPAADSNGTAPNGAATEHMQHSSGLPWPKWQVTTQPVHHKQQPHSTEGLLKHEQTNGSQASNSQASDSKSDGRQCASQPNGSHSHTHTDVHQSPGHTTAATCNGDLQSSTDAHTDGASQTATYDALVVCNGHYSAPRCPDVEGASVFPGQVMHSHSYRHNDAFKGQTVVLVGASASGEDICREIAEVADKVMPTLLCIHSSYHLHHVQGLSNAYDHPVCARIL